MKNITKVFTLAIALFSIQTSFAQMAKKMVDKMHDPAVTVIQLAQVPGEYETTELNLAPGKYIFEVTNKNVDKGLGFYLTPTSDAKAQVPNSGLEKLVKQGETSRTGIVDLTAGTYQYSCPLNPTPHYKVTVAEGPTVIQLSQTVGEYETKELNLAPGQYIFEVTNKDVAKGLGFYLTPTSDAKAQVPNSGLEKLVKQGETSRTGVVDLTAGNYQYSCPLNPTPHYQIKVASK